MIARLLSTAIIVGVWVTMLGGFAAVNTYEAHRSITLAAATTHGITGHQSLGGSPRRSKSWQHH